LTQKAKEQELKSKDLEKAFLKENSMDLKKFMSSYLGERKEYHRFQILKQKVNA
jgi:hypothetical protein